MTILHVPLRKAFNLQLYSIDFHSKIYLGESELLNVVTLYMQNTGISLKEGSKTIRVKNWADLSFGKRNKKGKNNVMNWVYISSCKRLLHL